MPNECKLWIILCRQASDTSKKIARVLVLQYSLYDVANNLS